MRRITGVASRALAASVLLVALAGVGIASGHGSAASRDYSSKVTSITPDDAPVTAVIKGGDDRLLVTNTGDEELLIYGYQDKDPYVRIGPDGVFVNLNSQTFYANRDRYGGDVPKGVGDGPPKWARVEDREDSYTFHDHRIHWMLRKPPASVDVDDSSAQKVFDWEIPVRYGDQDGEISGRLDYIGGQGFVERYGEFLLLGAGVLVFAVIMLWRRLRRSDAGATPAAGDDASD